MAFAALTIDLNARIANIERDLGKAAHIAEVQSQRMQTAFAGVSNAAAALGIGLGVGGFMNFIKSSVDAADNLNDLSQKIGVSVENLAGYKLAAEQSGTSLEGMGNAARFLNKNLAENDPLLKKLGITATDANGAMVQLSDVFAAMPDGAQKTAIAMQLMGKPGADMIPLLNGGGDALRKMLEEGQKLYPVTAEMARAADQFNESLGAFKVQASGVGITIANILLPGMNSMLGRWNDAITLSSQHGGFIGLVLNGINPTGMNSDNLKEINRQIDNMKKQLSFVPKDADTSKFDAELTRLNAIKTTLLEIQRAQALALNDKYGTADYKIAKPPVPELDINRILTDAEAQQLQATLRKAFNTKPLDDFIAGFSDRASKIKQEYAKLAVDIEPRTGPATSTDTLIDIGGARSAAASGDKFKADALIERAKSGLKDLASFEQSYYARQLQDLELGMNTAATKAAEASRDSIKSIMNQQAAELAKIDPVHIPIAVDAIAQDWINVMDVVRKDLTDRPFVAKLQVIGEGGASVEQSLRYSALKVGAR